MEWTASESRPGYREKTLQHGSVTITVYRPELSPEETKTREKTITSALKPILAQYISRIER